MISFFLLNQSTLVQNYEDTHTPKPPLLPSASHCEKIQGIDPEALEIQKADDWFLNDAPFI